MDNHSDLCLVVGHKNPDTDSICVGVRRPLAANKDLIQKEPAIPREVRVADALFGTEVGSTFRNVGRDQNESGLREPYLLPVDPVQGLADPLGLAAPQDLHSKGLRARGEFQAEEETKPLPFRLAADRVEASSGNIDKGAAQCLQCLSCDVHDVAIFH